MPSTKPSGSGSQPKKKKAKLTTPSNSTGKIKTVKLDSSLSTPGPSSRERKLNPLTAFAKSPVLESHSQTPRKSKSNGTDSQKKELKGKKKADLDYGQCEGDVNDRLWVDMYEPATEADLAVHKRKVEDVRRWFVEAFEGGPSGKLRKYRRILALTGPAGTAKTATVRVLARELGFDILEWRNSMSERFVHDDYGDGMDNDGNRYGRHTHGIEQEPLFTKFQAFLTRASSCRSIFSSGAPSARAGQSSQPHSQSQSTQNLSTTPSSSSNPNPSPKQKEHVILLEDLPNILHASTQSQFHASLQALLTSPASVPIVIIISDTGVRGEVGDERLASGEVVGGGRAGWGREGVVDVRSVLGGGLLGSGYVTQIGFNPIAPTLLRKALQSLLSRHFSFPPPSQQKMTPKQKQKQPPKEIIDMIVDSSNGDIRSAIMALQFTCVVELPRSSTGSSTDRVKGVKGKGKAMATDKGRKMGDGGAGGGNGETEGVGTRKGARKGSTRFVLEAVTRRESSLALFHLMGKILYNKRKDDPPNPSATTKDIQREKELDVMLYDPPPLPTHLSAHERRTSRVDVDMVYADSPIDSSLFSLYIQQNYTQFCNEIEECEGVSDWLSWVDSSGGEAWYQANPHQFHLLTLGTLHSLPSPVARRSQKIFKPEFFEALKREREAADGVGDVRGWLGDVALGFGGGALGEGTGAARWSRAEVAVELGGWLKAIDRVGSSVPASQGTSSPPYTHRHFSTLTFAHANSGGALLGERDDDGGAMAGNELDEAELPGHGDGRDVDISESASRSGGWLESDDIEEF